MLARMGVDPTTLGPGDRLRLAHLVLQAWAGAGAATSAAVGTALASERNAALRATGRSTAGLLDVARGQASMRAAGGAAAAARARLADALACGLGVALLGGLWSGGRAGLFAAPAAACRVVAYGGPPGAAEGSRPTLWWAVLARPGVAAASLLESVAAGACWVGAWGRAVLGGLALAATARAVIGAGLASGPGTAHAAHASPLTRLGLLLGGAVGCGGGLAVCWLGGDGRVWATCWAAFVGAHALAGSLLPRTASRAAARAARRAAKRGRRGAAAAADAAAAGGVWASCGPGGVASLFALAFLLPLAAGVLPFWAVGGSGGGGAAAAAAAAAVPRWISVSGGVAAAPLPTLARPPPPLRTMLAPSWSAARTRATTALTASRAAASRTAAALGGVAAQANAGVREVAAAAAVHAREAAAAAKASTGRSGGATSPALDWVGRRVGAARAWVRAVV
jgi:hypothetical protein